MRRVLFVAYDFPPLSGVGGGLRSANFVRYLPEFGWQAHVIALDGGQAPTSGVVRIPSPTPWHRPYEVGPYGWAYALARHLRTSRGDFDLVYVSCPPFPQALTAATFAIRAALPLVIDFRDAWSLDPYQEGSRLKRLLYRHVFPGLERRLVERTDCLILNTPSALKAYQALYPGHADAMLWLANGFDESAFPRCLPDVEGEELVLLHAGRFGIGRRSPANLLSALALARQRGCKVRLEILGDQSPSVAAEIARSGLGDAVSMHAQVDYDRAVRSMCAAGVLVLIQAPTRAPVQAVAGKTFDYLRTGRPVLYIGPDGDNLELVKRHAAHYAHPADNPAAIADSIANFYTTWRHGELAKPRVDRGFAATFERRSLTANLARRFDEIAAGKPS